VRAEEPRHCDDLVLLDDVESALTTVTEQIATKDRKLSEMTEMYAEAARDAEAAEQRLTEVEAERDKLETQVESRDESIALAKRLYDALKAERDRARHDHAETLAHTRRFTSTIAALKAEQERLREALTGLLTALPVLWGDAVRDGQITLSVSEHHIDAALSLSGDHA
jgi:chromosome segregation ATPase